MTSIEPGTPVNDMLNIPGSGLICLTNDSPKVFVYYIPVSSPREKRFVWIISPCRLWVMHQNGVHFWIISRKNWKRNPWIQVWRYLSFNNRHVLLCVVYDDYKFLTLKELDTLGLSHLIGSDLLRAYMHGYFMDIRLYNQVEDFPIDRFFYPSSFDL